MGVARFASLRKFVRTVKRRGTHAVISLSLSLYVPEHVLRGSLRVRRAREKLHGGGYRRVTNSTPLIVRENAARRPKRIGLEVKPGNSPKRRYSCNEVNLQRRKSPTLSAR